MSSLLLRSFISKLAIASDVQKTEDCSYTTAAALLCCIPRFPNTSSTLCKKLELPPTPNLLPPPPQPQQSAAATSCSHSSLSTFNTTKTTTTTTRGLLRFVAWRAKRAIYNLVTLPQTSPKPSKEAALDGEHGIRE
jgi:hypothetical protein